MHSLKPYFKIKWDKLVNRGNLILDKKLRTLVHKIFKEKPVAEFKYWYDKHKNKDFKSTVVCKTCGKLKRRHTYIYCSMKCRSADPEFLDKYRESWYANYDKNMKICSKSWFGTKRHKEALIEKYGTTNLMEVESIRQKQLNTIQKRYGVECTFQIPEVIEKSKQTCKEKYGVDNYAKTDEFKSMFTSKFNKQRAKKYYATMKRVGFKGNTSTEELKLLAYIQQYFDVESPYRSDDYPFNCDFYLPELDTYIEYQGFFTHGTEPYNGRKKQHKEIVKQLSKKTDWASKLKLKEWTKVDPLKRKTAKINKLNYVEWWSLEEGYDWINNKAKQLNKIKYYPWDNKQPRQTLKPIYARKCVLKEITTERAIKFLDKYHFQKSCRGQTVCYGLYADVEVKGKSKNQLVCVMTFGKPRYNKNYDWELLRLCSKRGFSVVGGASKLFKHFTDLHKGQSVISYCDMGKFSGNVYLAIGFKLLKANRPSVHWYNPRLGIHITDNLLRQRGFDQLLGDIVGKTYGKNTDNISLMYKHNFIDMLDEGQNTYVYDRV